MRHIFFFETLTVKKEKKNFEKPAAFVFSRAASRHYIHRRRYADPLYVVFKVQQLQEVIFF